MKKLTVSNLSLSYGKKQIFTNLNFVIEAGKIFTIVGKNGSGKTSLLNCFLEFNKPTAGRILYDGKAIKKIKKKIAYISQEFDLVPYLSIYDNIYFFLKFYKKMAKKEKIYEKLTDYNLFDEKDTLVIDSSKGMFKKTQIILMLLLNAEINLLDEPFDGLDFESQNKLTLDLKQLKKNSIILIVSHDSKWIQENTDSIFSMDNLEYISKEKFRDYQTNSTVSL